MRSDSFTNTLSRYSIAVALSLGATVAIAAEPAAMQAATAQTAAINFNAAACPQSCRVALSKAAAESPQALMYYIRRTRTIYNLYIWDFVPKP